MQRHLRVIALLTASALIALLAAVSANAATHTARGASVVRVGGNVAVRTADPGTACSYPAGQGTDPWVHCYTPFQIRSAYGLDAVGDPATGTGMLGQGQTIVLVDAYGSPTAANDLRHFHDTFYPSLRNPNFEELFPLGRPNYQNVAKGNGVSGPAAAFGWSLESTLDFEWAYAVAPLAHIVLVAVPPAETLGVQGFPNLMKAIQQEVAAEPSGTVFSQSFGISENTFEGAAQVQAARFDQTYQAALAKGDTVFASSGDWGTTGFVRAHKGSFTFTGPQGFWPTSSPYVTSVGGTQLQDGWTWDPTCDVPFTTDFNPCYFNWVPGGFTEAVWNESWLPAATGGGVSSIYPRPSWQDVVADRIPGNHRGFPDLSWNAAVNGGVLVYTSAYPNWIPPGWYIFGGTSASSPQVTAVVALANEKQAETGHAPIGYLNPLLYQIGDSGGAFRDIVPVTQGTAVSGQLVNNQLFHYNADGSVSPGPVPGYPTLAGWDMTTGWGSPIAPAFINAITAARNATP